MNYVLVDSRKIFVVSFLVLRMWAKLTLQKSLLCKMSTNRPKTLDQFVKKLVTVNHGQWEERSV